MLSFYLTFSEDTWNLIIKIISIPSLFLLCFIFGIIPFLIKKCRTNESFLSYANTFSGGLFFGVGEFHLLAEGVQKLKNTSDLPISFFLAFLGYSLILFIQKVVFGYLMPNAEQTLKEEAQAPLEPPQETKKDSENQENQENQEVISNDLLKDENVNKMPLLNNSKDEDSVTLNVETERITLGEQLEKEKMNKKKLSGFIMLLALSIHGMFECLALGIQTNYKNTLFLFIALMIHKWAEAFALGVFFIQAKMAKKQFYLLMIFFSIVGPIGVVLGIVLSANASEFVEGIFLSVSCGTFLYVACSEVIVEEFSTPEKRYIKFFLYLIGGAFAAGLALFEELF